jgi:hypothetical protein
MDIHLCPGHVQVPADDEQFPFGTIAGGPTLDVLQKPHLGLKVSAAVGHID